MLIDHVSDLHLDNGMLSGQPCGWFGDIDVGRHRNPGAELLVVGGDIGEHAADAADFLAAAVDHYAAVVAVDGNHERRNPAVAAAHPSVHLLDRTPGRCVVVDGVAFAGSCLSPEDGEAISDVICAVDRFQADPLICAVVIVSHYVPTDRLGRTVGADIGAKCNGLLERLPLAAKPSAVVFGHLHVEVDVVIDGYRCVSNPRGYRAKRRDGSDWRGFKTLEVDGA